MARLLVRSGKDPFTPVSAETTLTQDVFNSNSGNYLFQHSVWKHLMTPGSELVSTSTLSERRMPQKGDAERINEEFDHFVVPMANAFRPEFRRPLERLTALIEQLTIPVTVVGVGAQAPHDLSMESMAPVDDVSRAFVSAVLDRSSSIGVRGEFTQAYLQHLGFPEAAVDIIGCPSLFLHGGDFSVHRKVETLSDDSALALNLTPEVPGIGAFATAQAAAHPNLTYIGQDQHDLRLLLWGTPFPHVDDPSVPVHLDHPLYRSGRQTLFVDTWTWYDFLAEHDFAYGTRFHGNVAALLAGTPALLLAHDSRTLELARYHEMPYVDMPSFHGDIDVHDLYARTDLSAFNAAMPDRFGRYRAFLSRNGLDHIWGPNGADPEFAERLAAADFPRAVRPLGSDIREIADRLQWMRAGSVLDMTRHPQRYDYPFEHPTYNGAGSRFARRDGELRDEIATNQQSVDEQLNEMTNRVRALEQSRLRPRLGRLKQRVKSWFGR